MYCAGALYRVRFDVRLHAKGPERDIVPIMMMLQRNPPVRCAAVDFVLRGIECIHSLLHIPGETGVTPTFNI